MSRTRTTLCGLLVLALLLVAERALAHAIGLSTGEYSAHGSTLVVKMAFARNEVAQLAPMLDKNRDGHITAAEVSEAKSLLTEKILRRIRVTQMGAECTPALDDAGLTEQDGILLGAHWSCSAADKPFEVQLDLLDDLARGHRHVARAVSGETTSDTVLFGDQKTIEVPAGAGNESEAPAASKSDARPGFGSFFRMGIEHILTGYDHLVFLFGLLLIPARLRSLLAIITAFTIAHSLTLGIAVLGIWTPPASVVEPAIALSIAYVGVEDLLASSERSKWKPDPAKRWRITFPFGLVHGFGFASALKEIGLAKASIPTALVAFNLGVESGQLAVLSVVLPLLIALRKKAWLTDRGVRLASIVVIAAGLVWFVARVVGAALTPAA
jgi:hydrogenase/urease accessory protein HupE